MGDKTKIAALRELIGQIPPFATPRKAFTPKQRRSVYEMQNGSCAGCEVSLTGSWPIDHVKPLAEGGAHELGNWMGLCAPCHRNKTSREASARAHADRIHKAEHEQRTPSRLQGRGFDRTKTRGFDGKVRARHSHQMQES